MSASPYRSSRSARRTHSVRPRSLWGRSWRAGVLLPVTAVLAFAGVVNAPMASAASVTSAVFTGGTGTVKPGTTLYARQNGQLSLVVTTSPDTQCVDIAGTAASQFTAQHLESSTAKTSWTFTGTAPSGDGVQALTAAASEMNKQGKCTGQSATVQGSYTLDNTGPLVTQVVTPAANAAGWNNSDVTVKWTATDAGSGVTATQPFKTDSVTSNGIVTVTAPVQSDRLGNTGQAGSVTVRVDKAAPTITAAQTKNADGTTTVTFTCGDSNSGGQQSSGIASCLAEGSNTNSKTVQPGVTVTGTAIDNAGNRNTATSTAPAGDTTAPSLSGAPTTSPNSHGWYKGNVVIDWTCSDSGSGIAGSCPADSAISSEGQLLFDTQTVSDNAGNTTTANSSPKVNIDKTAPTTGISGNSNNWVNGAVTVTLAPSDNLSGIASTSYSVDGGANQTGTSFSLDTEGDHTVSFFSTDKAGNAEAAQTVRIKIDKTAPTIGHSFVPSSYTDGSWTSQNVTVTFQCADQGGSGVASCTGDTTKSTEGEGQQVVGTATDGAGNTATNTAVVSIDKTAPVVTATADRAPNAAGWYDNNVTVSFDANDALSGVASKTADNVLVEGANQNASGSATDEAGNTGSDSVTGINIDKTAPTLSGSFASGWHTDDVTVNWSCTDGLSGVKGTQPADTTVSGEGDHLSSTASCEDVAGNTTTKTVSGIKIDRTDPTTQAKVADPNGNGWYSGAVQVTLNASDNLSGIASTKYSVDGGAAQSYTGAFSFGTEGTHTISFWSTDVAGNTETAGAPITLRIDKTAPTTSVINPISPDSGWFATSGIPVAFDANDSGSGIAATYYTIDGGARRTYGEPFTADLSTGTHTIAYWSVDLAGNEESHETTNTVQVKVDTIAPTITGSRSPVANSFGWNNTDVDVTFECSDSDSGIDGIAGCGPNQTVASEGLNQHVQGDAQDIAGNKSSTTVSNISIDKTAPSLVGAPTGDANGGEWYRSNVSVAWTGDDGLSGIDPATQPADSTISAEGRNLGASASIFDKAGNKGTGSASGINIDKTAPVVTGVLPTGKNAAGWYRGDVVVGFTCADPALADGSAGSGVANCPADVSVSGNGANQSATSAAATDVAGNSSAAKTVTGINIDGSEPQTTADNKCADTFCTGTNATVVLSSNDVGPSGVKEIRYTINSGTEQVAAGATTTVSVPLSGTGAATVKYYAVDVAGNVEPTNTATVKYDNIAPTVTHTVTPKANAADWNKSDVTVHFDATDTDPGSGLVAGSVTPDQLVSNETSVSGLVVNGSARDTAGNTGTDSVTVKLDKTAPSINGSIVSGTLGNNGWYVSPVGVKFTCADALSGLAVCPDDENITLSNNGAGQSVTRSAKDKADNVSSKTVSGINIDNENPSITDVNVAGGFYKLGATPAATCTATDSFSGLLSCKVAVTGGTANGVGTFSYTATATDKAGNISTQRGTYKVTYRFDGFLQPINDTAHQIGTSTSVFKAGSTIPVKFQLKNAAGTAVQAATAPVWLTPVLGAKMSMAIDESAVTVSADSGSTFRYDATAQQYIYNWKTPSTGGNYYQIGVRLDDGQIYYVNIGLR